MNRGKTDKLNYLKKGDLDRLKNLSLNIRDDLIISILYETGCTVNELVNIKFKDFHILHNELIIRSNNARNNEQRTVYISGNLIRKITAYRAEHSDSPFILYTRQSSSMTTKRIRQIVQKTLALIGVVGGPQLLRYTHIVHAYKKNIPLDAIQKQVGLKRSRAIEIFSMLPEQNFRGAYAKFTE